MDEETVRTITQKIVNYAIKLGLYYRDVDIHIESYPRFKIGDRIPFPSKNMDDKTRVSAPIEKIT